MRLISLSLENFRQHRSTEIHFPAGLTGILGANGSGKSTILEAIAWTLYGNQAGVTRGDTDSLIWRLAPGRSSAVCELTFAFHDRTFTVKRSQSGNKGNAELVQDGRAIATSTKAVNEKLSELLGMTHTEFFNSYFTGQKDLNFLGAIKGATERERFIAKMLGYERLTEVQGATNKPGTIRDDLSKKKYEAAKLEGSLGSLDTIEQEITTHRSELEIATAKQQAVDRIVAAAIDQKTALEPQLVILETTRDQHLGLERQQHVQQANLAQVQRQIEQVTKDRSQLSIDAERYVMLSQEVANYEQMRSEYEHLTSLKQAATRHADLSTRSANLQIELTQLERQLDELGDISTQLGAGEIAIEQLQNQIRSTENDIQTQTRAWQEEQADLKARIKTEQQQLKKLKSQRTTITDAGEAGVCPTCERHLGEEYDPVVGNFSTQLDHSQHHITTWQSQLQSIDAAPSNLIELQAIQTQLNQTWQSQQKQQNTLTANLAKLQIFQKNLTTKQTELSNLTTEIATIPTGFDPNLYDRLTQQIRTLKPKYEDYLRLSDIPQRLAQADIQIHQLQTEQQQIINSIETTTASIDRIAFSENSYRQIKASIVTVTEQLETARQTQNQAQQQVAIATHALQISIEREAEYHRKAQDYQVARTELGLLEELDRAYTSMRSHFTDQIRPQLADNASLFLAQLTDGRYNALEIDSKYNIVVLDDGDRKPVISGGEEDIVNLSLRLAISQMITERSGQPFSLLILDEVFGSLDDTRRDNVIGLLHSLEQQFEQVLIISHMEAIKDSLNNIIRLEFDPKEQCSRVAID